MMHEIDREIRLLLIFLEYPGGLRFREVKKIAKERSIYSSPSTLNARLQKLVRDEVLQKDELGHYVFPKLIRSLSEPLKYTFIISEKTEMFFDLLFKAYRLSDDKSPQLFGKLGMTFLSKVINSLTFYMLYLIPYFSDRRVREIWFKGLKYSLDLLAVKIDEMCQNFYGISASEACLAGMLTGEIQRRFILPQLKKFKEQNDEVNKTIHELIERVGISDEIKGALKSLTVS